MIATPVLPQALGTGDSPSIVCGNGITPKLTAGTLVTEA